MEIVLLIAAITLLVVAVRYSGEPTRVHLRDGLSATQTLLALCAIVLGVVWFLRARPDAPRVDLSLGAQVFATNDAGRPLLRADARLKNDGQTTLLLDRGAAMDFIVSRIVPFDPADVETRLAAPRPAAGPRLVDQLRPAAIHYDRMALSNMLESGETDQLTYYARLNCDEERLVSVRVVLQKPLQFWERALVDIGLRIPNAARETQFWHSDAAIDLTAICAGERETDHDR